MSLVGYLGEAVARLGLSPQCLGRHGSWGSSPLSGHLVGSAPTAHTGCVGCLPGKHSLPALLWTALLQATRPSLQDLLADPFVPRLATARCWRSCAGGPRGWVSACVPSPGQTKENSRDSAGLPQGNSRSDICLQNPAGRRPPPPPQTGSNSFSAELATRRQESWARDQPLMRLLVSFCLFVK